MSGRDWIVLGAVLALVGAALFFALKNRKKGGCCGDCSCCGAACRQKKADKSKDS